MTTETQALSGTACAAEDCPSNEATKGATNRAPHAGGVVWFGGWLFTIGFAKLVWWKAVLGLIAWPYFLGLALR